MPDSGGIPGDDCVCPDCGSELTVEGLCSWDGCGYIEEYDETTDDSERAG